MSTREWATPSSMAWERSTPWRQGYFLTGDAVAAFGLKCESESDVAAVVISHDCDLAQPSNGEPFVEVIVGRFLDLDEIDGNYAHTKNVRRLHTLCSAGDSRRAVELEIQRRTAIPKDSPGERRPGLADFTPCAAHRLTASERKALQYWLAARYHRSAFPDEFDRRLKDTGVAERLSKAFKDSGIHIRAMFFDVDQGEERVHSGSDDPYDLHVILVYATQLDPEAAESAAKSMAKRIEKIFEGPCRVQRDGMDIWEWIELTGVEIISDEALSYAQSLQLIRWQADHISLRTDPQQPMLEV